MPVFSSTSVAEFEENTSKKSKYLAETLASLLVNRISSA